MSHTEDTDVCYLIVGGAGGPGGPGGPGCYGGIRGVEECVVVV